MDMRLPYQYAAIIHEDRLRSLRRERRLEAQLAEARQSPPRAPSGVPATVRQGAARRWGLTDLIAHYVTDRRVR